MKDKLEALARLDGYYRKKNRYIPDGVNETYINDWHNPHGRVVYKLPPYLDPLEGHGHLQRLIDGLDERDYEKYCCALADIFDPEGNGFSPEVVHAMLKATVDQKAEALLRAKGLWEESDEG